MAGDAWDSCRVGVCMRGYSPTRSLLNQETHSFCLFITLLKSPSVRILLLSYFFNVYPIRLGATAVPLVQQ